MYYVLRIAGAANIILADFNLAVSTPTAKPPNLNPRQIFRLYVWYIERVTSRRRKIAVMGDGGVAGEGRVVGVPQFHSWGKCSMPLTNINSDWMSNVSLACVLYY